MKKFTILSIFFISSIVSCQASQASVQKIWNRIVGGRGNKMLTVQYWFNIFNRNMMF